MNDNKEKEEGVIKIGKGFDVNEDKINEIETLIDNLVDEGVGFLEAEKAIDQKYLNTGETYIAGFLLCFKLIGKQQAQDNIIRKKISDFMHGYHSEPINPLERNFITNLIDSRVVAGIETYVEIEDESVDKQDEKVVGPVPVNKGVVTEKEVVEPVPMEQVSKEEKEKNYDDAVNAYMQEVEKTTKVKPEPVKDNKKKGLLRKMKDNF